MRHGGRNAVGIRDIEFDHMGIASVGFDVGPQVLQSLQASAGQHHRRSGLRKGFGKLGAQATGSTGDQGHPSAQIDAVRHEDLLWVGSYRVSAC